MATGQLMFEVGVSENVKNLEKVKEQLNSLIENFSKTKAIQLKVEIENLDAINTALSKIGDSPKLRELRQEIESLNREFSKLATGAGGVGEIPIRGAKQEAVGLKAEFEAADRKLRQLTEDLDVMRRNRDMAKPEDKGSYTMPMKALKEQISAQEELVKKRQTAYEQAVENVGKVSNATKNATQQESEAMNHLKQQVVDLTDKVRILQTALSKSSGAPITSPINIDLSAIEPTIKTLNEAVNQLKKSMDLLWEATNRMEGSMKSLGGIEALEKIKTEATETKQQVDNLAQSVAGMSKQAEKKGSESTLADNLQRLKSAITDVRSEYNRLNETYGSAKDMGMPTNNAIEERLYNLRRLITMMEQLAQAALTAGSAEAEALSRSKAFSFVQFDNNQLFSKETNKLYSRKEIDGYIKSIEEFVKAEGRMAQTSGAATNTISEIGTALGRAAERASQAGNSFSQTTAGIQNFAMNIETARLAYDKTLRGIADLESRISAGQKANLDKESLEFMNGLKQRAQQWADVLKKILGEDMKGNPAYREFLSMSSSILTRPQMGNGLQALLGADWKILLKDIGSTFGMLMKFSGFNKELTLDNSTLANWLKGEEAVRRLDNALKDLNKQWAATNNEAKTPDLTAKYEAQKRAIESLIAQIKGAMTEESRMSNRNGLSDLLGVGFKNAVGYDNTRLIQEMKTASKDAVKAEAEYMKEVDKFTEQSKKAYAQAEKEKEKAAQERAKAVAAAEKEVQKEITKTESLQKNIAQSITRGEAAGRDMSGLKAQNTALEQQLRLMEALKNSISRGTIDPNSDIIGRRIKDIQVLREDTELLRKSEEKLNQAREQANRRNDNAAIKQLQDEEKSVKQAWNRYEELKIKITELYNLRQRAQEVNMNTDGINNVLQKYIELRNVMKDIIDNGGRTTSAYGRATRGMLAGEFWEAQGKATNKKANAELKSFNKDLTETERQSTKADANIRKLGMAFNELKNYMKANGGSEEMKRLQSEIQGAIQKMRQLMNAGNFAGAVNVYERMAGSLRQAATATKEFENSQHSLSSTISHTNGNLQNQSQILSDLKSMAMQYLSVWGAQSFINNIIELGGQLEQQRLSIGAILQDTAQANHLFSQIKDLAIRSPFGVQQLDAMTKQLSAYGFQYSELYEWTKRLADISAATGTSVDRLALALGHVRSEGALSGYTLRQFSMGNIPLLQKLSENLGKTKQEIRKMTRNKEIGYEDVLNVLKQLTDESGMFYQAQETMAQALNAKFKNLRDSFQIMYSEMAEGSPGDFLKGVAEVLTDISKSWRVLMPIILSGGAALGIWKLSTMALNHELERSGKLLVGNAIATSKYSMNQLRAIATTGRFKIALQGLGRALASIGKFVFNPVTLGFAAIEGLIYLWSKHNDEVRRAKDLTKAYGEEAVESEKNIAKQLENVKPFSNKLDDSALKTGIDSMTESIKNYAINGQSIINGMFSKDAQGNVMSLADKYQYLRGELEETIKVYKELKRVKDAFEYGITKSDGGWFDDDVDTDLTQYSEAYKKFVDDVTEYNSKYNNSIEKAIKNAQNSDLAFREATKNMKSYGEMLAEFWSNPNKYQNAAQFMNNLFGAGAGSDDALNLNESFFGYLNKKNEAMKELDQFIANTEERLKEKGYDFSKELAPEQVGALLKMSKEWIEKHPEWENIYGTIKDKLEGRWPIKIVPDTSPVEEELPEWMEEFQKELDKTGIVLTADMSMEQIVDLMKKAYDQAQTTINKLGPVALTAKINVVGMSEDEIEAYNNPLSPNYNPEMYQWLKQLKGAYNKRDTVDAAAKKRGIKLEGMKKDGTHKAEKQNQEAAKAVREQVRVIKEAADAFQYWREKVGDKGAWEHVQKEFGDVLQKIDITATNIEDVREHLKKIPQTKEYQAITDKKVKTEIDKEIAKENDQYTRKDFERDTERFLSQTQIQLDNLTRSWETFNSVREATGNIALAVQLSGAEYEANGNQNIADALKKKIQKDFESAGVVSIPLSVEWSDKQIEENVWEAFDTVAPKRDYFDNTKEGLDAYNKALLEHESRIKGVVEETKKWRDLQRDAQEKQRNSFAKLTADADALLTKMYSISTAFKDNSSAISAMYSRGEITQYQSELARWQNERMRSGSESEIKTSRLIMEAEMTNAFNEMGILLTTPLRAILDELRNETRTSGFRGRPMEEQMKVYNDIAKLEKVLNEFGSADVDGVSASMTSYILALGNEKKTYIELVEAQKRLTKAEENYEKAKRSGLEATINAAEEERNLAQERYNEALKSHTSSQANLAKAQSSANASLTKFTEGLNRFKSVVQGLTSKNASALWESIGPKAQQSVGMFISGAARLNSSLNKLGETLTENGSSVDIFQKQLGDVITNIISNSNPDNIISNVQSGISGIFTEVFGKGNFQDVKQSVQNVFGKIITDGLKEGKSINDISNDVGKITGSILSSISTIGNKSGQLWGMIIGMILQILDMLGDYETSIGGLIGDLFENILAAVGGIVKNVFSGNFFKNIGVGIFEGIGSWFGYKGHDEELQEEIDAINANVKALDANTEIIKKYRSRALGYDDGELRRRVGQLYKQTWVDFYAGFGNLRIEIPGLAAMKEFYNLNSKKTGYAAELENLKTQRLDILQMYALEDDKKDKSEEALSEYKKQIAELDEQILYFTEDLANELWGIDLQGWADQISDALWTAFENGESAVEAFGDTAKDIISDVARRMMNIHLIEPVFKALEDELFGKIGENGIRTGGVYNESTGQFDENETLRILGQFFGEDGEFAKVVESAEDFYEMAQRVTGINFTGEGDSSSASKTIKGITEQTADLLASYVSAIRLDVSVIRTLDAKVVQEYWPSQIRLMTAGTQSLASIENHTSAIMRSNDAIERSNQSILDSITGLKNRTWSVPMA